MKKILLIMILISTIILVLPMTNIIYPKTSDRDSILEAEQIYDSLCWSIAIERQIEIQDSIENEYNSWVDSCGIEYADSIWEEKRKEAKNMEDIANAKMLEAKMIEDKANSEFRRKISNK